MWRKKIKEREIKKERSVATGSESETEDSQRWKKSKLPETEKERDEETEKEEAAHTLKKSAY